MAKAIAGKLIHPPLRHLRHAGDPGEVEAVRRVGPDSTGGQHRLCAVGHVYAGTGVPGQLAPVQGDHSVAHANSCGPTLDDAATNEAGACVADADRLGGVP